MYDITKLRLFSGSVDYTAKNDLDSASRHHFWPMYTFSSSKLLIGQKNASKIDYINVYGHLKYDIIK